VDQKKTALIADNSPLRHIRNQPLGVFSAAKASSFFPLCLQAAFSSGSQARQPGPSGLGSYDATGKSDWTNYVLLAFAF